MVTITKLEKLVSLKGAAAGSYFNSFDRESRNSVLAEIEKDYATHESWYEAHNHLLDHPEI